MTAQERIARLLRQSKSECVLAEYGYTGVEILNACRLARLPLIVHFHGWDAYSSRVLDSYQPRYKKLFEEAAALVVVSRHMANQLVILGAPPKKISVIPCGVDMEKFSPCRPETANPTFVAVGRFVEKKAPHLTILAFYKVRRKYESARLIMVGDGPLLRTCQGLVHGLGLTDSVRFMGIMPHDQVAELMRSAHAFVQHSVRADDGDCEGTPVSVLEASASGLPVISTRHGGISDAVVDGKSGFLVDENDVDEMAVMMARVIENSVAVACMGEAGRQHMFENYSVGRQTARLRCVLAVAGGGATRRMHDCGD